MLWGNRNWDPYLNDALDEAKAAGYTKLIAIATSAYSSYSSCRQYREDFADALADTGLGEADASRSTRCASSSTTPASCSRSSRASATASPALEASVPGLDRTTEVEVLFATHSIPSTDAAKSGPAERGFGEGGAYAAQHRAVAEVVMREAGAGDVPWQLVYQSRAGPRRCRGSSPTSTTPSPSCRPPARKAVVIVPLGFVSDHMEVIWDLDNEALETAGEHGLAAVRVPTPGTHPAYVAGLVDLVLERVNGTPVAERPRRDRARPLVRRVPARMLRERAPRVPPGPRGIAP